MALHVASLPPLTLLAPEDPLCFFDSFSHGTATASHCRRGPLFGVALQMPSPTLMMQKWSCSAWPYVGSDADALAGTGYPHHISPACISHGTSYSIDVAALKWHLASIDNLTLNSTATRFGALSLFLSLFSLSFRVYIFFRVQLILTSVFLILLHNSASHLQALRLLQRAVRPILRPIRYLETRGAVQVQIRIVPTPPSASGCRHVHTKPIPRRHRQSYAAQLQEYFSTVQQYSSLTVSFSTFCVIALERLGHC
jgi:hypothetical protein